MSPEPLVPDVVIEAVFKWFGVAGPHRCTTCGEPHGEPDSIQLRKAHRVLREMMWDSLCGCWMVGYAGLTVGIELDGYIHS